MEQATGRGDDRELALREARHVRPVVGGGDQLGLGEGGEGGPLDGGELVGHLGGAVDEREGLGLARELRHDLAPPGSYDSGARQANRTPTPASRLAPVASAVSMPNASVTRPSTIGPTT